MARRKPTVAQMVVGWIWILIILLAVILVTAGFIAAVSS